MVNFVEHDRSDPHKRGWPLPACIPFRAGGFEEFPGTPSGPHGLYVPGLSRGLVIHPAAVSRRIAAHLAAHLTFEGQTPDGEELNTFHSTFRQNWVTHEVFCSEGFLIDNLTGKDYESLMISDEELREIALDPDRHLDPRWIDFRTAVVNGKRAFTMLPIPGWSPQIVFRVVIDVDLFEKHYDEEIRHSPSGDPDLPAASHLLRSPKTLLGIEAARYAPKAIAGAAAVAAAAIKFKS